MTDVTVAQAEQRFPKFQRFMAKALAAAAVLAAAVGSLAMRGLRSGGALIRTAGSRAVSAVVSCRLPVSHATHSRVTRQLERFEVQTISSVRTIECREKRTRALLALARTAHEIGRDTRIFLVATLEELQVKHCWERKQERIFVAAQLACSVAGLAAVSGHAGIGTDAYLCGQHYYGKVEIVDRKIGLAAAFADVASLLDAPFDQASWLAVAMELACGITEYRERTGAVNFVARKMVVDHIPPCDDRVADRRFAVDASPVAKTLMTEVVAAPMVSGSGTDELDFETQ